MPNPTPEYLQARITELEDAIKHFCAVTNTAWPTLKNTMIPAEFDRPVVKYKNIEYSATGKYGNRIKDGMMGQEYRHCHDRIWVYRNGTIIED